MCAWLGLKGEKEQKIDRDLVTLIFYPFSFSAERRIHPSKQGGVAHWDREKKKGKKNVAMNRACLFLSVSVM